MIIIRRIFFKILIALNTSVAISAWFSNEYFWQLDNWATDDGSVKCIERCRNCKIKYQNYNAPKSEIPKFRLCIVETKHKTEFHHVCFWLSYS